MGVTKWLTQACTIPIVNGIRSSRDSGLCLQASGEQTLLSIELCIVSGKFAMGIGSWDSGLRLWRPVSTHCSVSCVCSFKSIHYGDWFTGFGILPLDVRGSNTARH
jgi:hypothetical protein